MRARLVFLVLLAAAAFPASTLGSGTALKTVSAKLTAGAVKPMSSSTATGSVVVRLDAKANKACWTISVKGATSPLSAHVHRGLAGKNGPVVIPLGDKWAKQGCVSVPAKSIAAVAASPKSFYVDVHTRPFVNGAVRGQLRAGS